MFANRLYSLWTHKDLPVGARVRIANPCVDFRCFRTNGPASLGTVVASNDRYLGIAVKMDITHCYPDPAHDGKYIEIEHFNFQPTDLILIRGREMPMYKEQSFEYE